MINNNNKKILKKKNKLITITIIAFAIIVIVALIVFCFIKPKDIFNGKEPINEKFSFLVQEESTMIKNDDIFSGQINIKNEYIKKYRKGNYTINNPYVIINPYLISPQTALIIFKTNKNEKITLTLKGKHNDDLITTFEASKDHYIPVYGLYGDYENTLIIETESGKKNTIKIKIEDKADTGSVKVLENNITNSNGEFYFATSSLGMGAMAYDNYGEVRWWLDMGYSKGMTMLQNGNILLSSANEGPDVTSTSGVVEVDMLGFVHNEYEIDGGYHHDGFELENGNLIILTSNLKSNTIADYIIEINRKTGKVVKDWNLKEIVEKIDPNLISDEEITWGWINSVSYDKNTNSLILSVRNQNSVVSLDYDKKTINWILGQEKYWSSSFRKYLIKGIGNDFIYPAGQHSVNITDEGYLSIFNNGYDSYKEQAVSCKSLKDNESYAMLYNIDTEKMEAKVVWKFGGQEYFSYALSSFTYAKDNHKIFNSGWHFTDKVNYNSSECTQFSNDSYDAYLIDFDKNNNISVKLHINESKFEVVKAPIYNLGVVSVKSETLSTIPNYNVSEGKYLSTHENDKYEILSEDEALKYASNEPLFITFQMYNKRFRLIGSVPEKMDMKITFISTRGIAYRYILKEKNQDIKDFIIISDLPKGRYYVYVNMNEFIYNTTEYIEIN